MHRFNQVFGLPDAEGKSGDTDTVDAQTPTQNRPIVRGTSWSNRRNRVVLTSIKERNPDILMGNIHSQHVVASELARTVVLV